MNKIFFLLVSGILFTTAINGQLEISRIQEVVKDQSNSQPLEDAVVDDLLITDNFTSKGIHHVYFKQQLQGIELYESYAALHGKGTNFTFQTNRLIRGIRDAKLSRLSAVPFEQILEKVVSAKKYDSNYSLSVVKPSQGVSRKATYSSPEISNSDIQTRLVYTQVEKQEFKLARVMTIDEVNSSDYLELLVDAVTGEIISEKNYTVYCEFGSSMEEHQNHAHIHEERADVPSIPMIDVAPNQYQVYPYPIESPLYGGQSVVTEPWLEGSASPNGWHTFGGTTYTTTRGNNVDAYLDDNNSNSPTGGDAARAEGGANLEFLFVHDEGLPVTNGTNQSAALTNLFYWNNLVHDMWANYGFDEASGNFQEENYGGQGTGSDYVRAEAQDGGGTCNANMATPADGGNPRMQMYLCNGRDGDFDNGVVVHEYGHGISNRLTGGRSQAGCLGNQEQMGEGWSDYLGIVMTIESGDIGTDLRPIGNYLFGQGANGGGIRAFPYTTDMNENPFTYDDIKTQSVPHGVGSVWATMLWDMTWALIDEYGYDSDLYNGTGGNNLAMQLVIEGMKIQPCSPGFVDGRDAILQADVLLNEGANQCLIWQAFADRGLGYSASQGSSGDRSDGTEAFDMPPVCSISFDKTANRVEVEPGQTIVYTLTATNNKLETVTNVVVTDDLPEFTSFVTASDGGQLTGNTVTFPGFDLTSEETKTVTLEVLVDNNISPNLPDFSDDLESGTANWIATASGSTSFSLSTNESSSPVNSWFAPDEPSPGIANIEIVDVLYISGSSELAFTHNYDTEITWDGGVVEISLDNGATWLDLGSNFIANGYNSTINNSRPAFSGNSNGFITSVVDLSDYEGAVAKIRFQMNCDQSVGGVGWYIDDVSVTNQVLSIPNVAELDEDGVIRKGVLMNPTIVIEDPSILSISTGKVNPTCSGNSDGLAFVTATSGTGNYTYLWSTGATVDTISNLSAGTYSVTVDDGITNKVAQVNVIDPQEIDINISSTDAINGSGGTATAIPSNGTAPYSYLWNNNETTQTIIDLGAGIYSVIITDDNLCEAFDTVEVFDPVNCSDKLVQIDIQMDNWPEDITLIVRDDQNNVVFENGPYNGVPANSLVTEYVCLPDGCYTIEIDDSYGDGLCNGSQTGFYNIIDYDGSEILFSGCDIGGGITHDLCYPLLTHVLEKTNPSCTGLSDASIDLTLSGGNPGVSILYSTGATTEDISGLSAGQYTVEITDGVRTINDTVTIDASTALVYLSQGNEPGSLSYAVEQTCSTDTVRFEDNLLNQMISVDQRITMKKGQVIKGQGPTLISISGMNTSQIFEVPVGSSGTIIGLKLMDAQSNSDGGAILNNGTITLENVHFENNLEGTTAKSLTNNGELIIKGESVIEE